MAESLFLFEGVDVAAALGARNRGQRVLAWSDAAAGALNAATIPFDRSVDALGDDPEMPLYRAAADWTQAFGNRAVDARGQSLKSALRFRETTLWWWAELYLHHNTDAARRVRFLEKLARVIERFGGKEVRTHGLPLDETVLAERFCAANRLGFVRGGLTNQSKPDSRPALTLGLIEAGKLVATAVKGGGGRDERLIENAVVFVSHAAFWRTRVGEGGGEESYEHYFDALLAESKRWGLPIVTLGVGPQSTFRTRTAAEKWRERLSIPRDDRYVSINRFVTPRLAATALKAFGGAVRVCREFQDAPSMKEAFSHRDVSFADMSREDLGRTLLHQTPWAARCLLEFGEAFRKLKPRLVCLYAESSGLGRAAIEAARELKVKSLGVQHGILYPNYFSYERTPADVSLGSPLPDTTALYGRDGVRLLETTFHYPSGRVVATGAPRYDALAAETGKVNREERRLSLGVSPASKLVILASRYTGIRDTHKAAGPTFATLLGAIAGLPHTQLIVKPHPAERSAAYDREIQGADLGERVRVIADRSLNDLLPAADLLVTVESLSATEALVAGVPVVVLRHPSNLRGVVASGAALGVPDGADPLAAIESLLFDDAARQKWRESRDTFLAGVAHGVDGHSLNRLMTLLSTMAGLSKGSPQ